MRRFVYGTGKLSTREMAKRYRIPNALHQLSLQIDQTNRWLSFLADDREQKQIWLARTFSADVTLLAFSHFFIFFTKKTDFLITNLSSHGQTRNVFFCTSCECLDYFDFFFINFSYIWFDTHETCTHMLRAQTEQLCFEHKQNFPKQNRVCRTDRPDSQRVTEVERIKCASPVLHRARSDFSFVVLFCVCLRFEVYFLL